MPTRRDLVVGGGVYQRRVVFILCDAMDYEALGIKLQSELTRNSGGQKAMLFVGKQLRETAAWYGPIVMNT